MRFLLLQIRDANDPMRTQEVGCFATALECQQSDIVPFDLLSAAPSRVELDKVDTVLVGGSGNYSAAGEGQWLERALDGLREITLRKKPMFASCWGFQALARALGGRCEHAPQYAELGTIEFTLTNAGRDDPLFATLPPTFLAQAGHEDYVTQLPDDVIWLASSQRAAHQAFRIAGAPIYCTQFHPEVDLQALFDRLNAYPRYVESIAGVPFEEFRTRCRETPEANALLRRFKETLVREW